MTGFQSKKAKLSGFKTYRAVLSHFWAECFRCTKKDPRKEVFKNPATKDSGQFSFSKSLIPSRSSFIPRMTVSFGQATFIRRNRFPFPRYLFPAEM